jgi:hypothetical protein
VGTGIGVKTLLLTDDGIMGADDETMLEGSTKDERRNKTEGVKGRTS